MLHVVVEHGHEPNPERHRRRPPFIDNPVEFGVAQLGHQLHRLRVRRLVKLASSPDAAVAAATAATCSLVCPYPWSIILVGSPSRPAQPCDDHTWGTLNAAAT